MIDALLCLAYMIGMALAIGRSPRETRPFPFIKRRK